MAKNFQKAERNIKIDGEYKLLSYASSSESVEMTDGTDLQTKMDSVDRDLSSHTSNTSNPHSVTKAQIGLGNVENKSSATIRGEITKSNVTTALGYTPLNQSLKGSASGLAELDSNGKVPSSQLPSFVDDVVEGYLSGGKFYKESSHTTEISGETGKIYIDLSTEKTYRWSGSAFVVISETLALGETSSTAYRGDRGKIAYDHSQSTHAPTNAEANQNAFSNVVVGSTTIAANSKTDTLTLVAGSNVTITPDTTNDKITISSAHPSISKSTDTTSTASPSAGGTFTAVDSITRDSNGHITKINTKTVTLPSTSVKVDSALSSTSINPVQNKVVTEQLTELNSNLTDLKVGEVAGGKNIWDEEWENGVYNLDTGEKQTATYAIRNKNLIPIKPNTDYFMVTPNTLRILYFGEDKTYLSSKSAKGTFKSDSDARFLAFQYGESTYKNNIAIVEGTSGVYEPYIPSVKMLAEDKADKSEVCVNLLKPTLGTITINGVTCTNNGDGTYTLNGTATADTPFILKQNVVVKKGTKLVGCPSGGNPSKYFIGLECLTSPYTKYARDYGDGSVVSADTSSENAVLFVRIISGQEVSDLTFKPMLTTDLSATYDDFVPYTGDKGRINEEVAFLRRNIDYTSEENCIGNLLGEQLYRVTFSKTFSSATVITTGVDVLLDGQGGLLEGNSIFNNIKDLVNVESFIETESYKLTNYLAVKKDKTGHFYVRNLVDTALAIRLILTLYYTKF